jgi:membrane protein YdbS with pleckstrin-like domain
VAFPKRLLNTGEEVVVDLRPHWWFFAGPATLLLLCVVGLVVAASTSAPGVIKLALSGITLATLAWFAGRYTRWATTTFAVTTDRIVYRHGVVGKQGIEIPLERVNTIFFHQGIWERVIGTGDLTIESAGEHGSETFSDIRKPSHVQNEIYRLMEENATRTYGGGARELSIPEQIDRLDELRRRGVITEAEFQAKKTQLLDRM